MDTRDPHAGSCEKLKNFVKARTINLTGAVQPTDSSYSSLKGAAKELNDAKLVLVRYKQTEIDPAIISNKQLKCASTLDVAQNLFNTYSSKLK